tara:strand:+ start:129 stop:1259 length:1131 start_codon:yes stop_codon:yes gene_type:complete
MDDNDTPCDIEKSEDPRLENTEDTEETEETQDTQETAPDENNISYNIIKGYDNADYDNMKTFKDFTVLSKYPSFQHLENKKQNELIKKINDTIKKGKTEKWLIDDVELEIQYPPIARGSGSFIHNCIWRDSTIVIKRPNTKKVSLLKDLFKEIDIWSTLRHPNLVQFLGISFNREMNDFYILMEKIDGINLKQFINNKHDSNISNNNKFYICRQLINVIKFIHLCNPPVIYRDLKPENIMIDKQYNLKLTDFGLSRFMPDDEGYKLTGETGTIRYMAPEVYLGKEYDLKVDVYSLGLIIYNIYTRIIPFEGYNTETIKLYFTKPDLIFSTEQIKDKKLRYIINMCIQKNPDNRWDINKLSGEFNNSLVENAACCIF